MLLLLEHEDNHEDDPNAEDDDDELTIEHVHAKNPWGFQPAAVLLLLRRRAS